MYIAKTCSGFLVVLGVLASLSQSLQSEIWKKDSLSQSLSATVHKKTCNATANEVSTCNFGYYCINSSCQCRKAPNENVVKCNDHNFAVLTCYCATFNQKKALLQVGSCAWNCLSASISSSNVSGVYRILNNMPPDYNMCLPLKRTGALCGRCLPAWSLSFGLLI